MSRTAHRIVTFTLALWSGLQVAPVSAAERAPAEGLRDGWQEYGFQTWPDARARFREALNSSRATAPEKFQARLGLAFVTQYQLPGSDPEAAIPLYEGLLAELPARDPLRALMLAQLGSCRLEAATPDYPRGRELLRKALAISNAPPVVAEETAIRLLASYLQRPSLTDFQEGLAAAAEWLPRLEGTALESVGHGIASRLAYAVGDLKRFEAELVAQERSGVRNRTILGAVLFQIARVNEVEFHDYRKAAAYYHRLHDELPTSAQAWFAGVRAAELDRGKIDSDYAPPLIATNAVMTRLPLAPPPNPAGGLP